MRSFFFHPSLVPRPSRSLRAVATCFVKIRTTDGALHLRDILMRTYFIDTRTDSRSSLFTASSPRFAGIIGAADAHGDISLRIEVASNARDQPNQLIRNGARRLFIVQQRDRMMPFQCFFLRCRESVGALLET